MTPTTAPRTILLVEDDESLASILARHLSAHDLPTTIASSAEEAEERLDGGLRPAVLLLDINLPGGTGWSLLRGTAFAAAGSPPVIVVSAVNVPTARLREHGVAGYLPKPFAPETLRATIERVLETEGNEE